MTRRLEIVVEQLLDEGDALIIVPPFAVQNWPALGVHLLQACAAREGFRVRVLYASLLYAALIGERAYHTLSNLPTAWLLGERIFARSAYGVPPLGNDQGSSLVEQFQSTGHDHLTLEALREIESRVQAWLDAWTPVVAASGFEIIGCSTSFEQTASSLSILSGIKRHNPQAVTILGGANCEGPMAEGLAELSRDVDHVFSGECESVFPEFLGETTAGRRSAARTIRGAPCLHLDELPEPDFHEYFEQVEAFLPDGQLARGEAMWLPYESSRGCWWGQKHHCTFCGLNGEGMSFRQKKPDRVLDDLKRMSKTYGIQRVSMVDNIMPHGYFRTLLPRLARKESPLHIAYEQKANMTLSKVGLLHDAGVHSIQPGIEALSTELLTLMDKGVTAPQNIALMRYARAYGIQLQWNLLCGFPGDKLEYYEQTLRLVRLLWHLCPPSGIAPLSIDRFSPYFERPGDYGVRNLQPRPEYEQVLPSNAPIDRIAYHFTGDYASESLEHSEIITAIRREVIGWRSAWSEEPEARPRLEVVAGADGRLEIMDSRRDASSKEAQSPRKWRIGEEQARRALVPGAIEETSSDGYRFLLEEGIVVELDEKYIPLATAEPQLLSRFESSETMASVA